MIPVDEAQRIVKEHMSFSGTESVAVANSCGRLLREDIIADRDFPPFDRVAMDGIAIEYGALSQRREFKIQGIQPAGHPQLALDKSDYCIESMTGAILPLGCDTVVAVEDLSISSGIATIKETASIRLGQHVHKKGSDASAETILIRKGCRIAPTHIAVCSAVGKQTVLVEKVPRISVISTGDEVVATTEVPAYYQIRQSNTPSMVAALEHHGHQVGLRIHLSDNRDELLAGVSATIECSDLVILSGGISKGNFDHLPSVFETLGVRCLFRWVAQKPGKPFWFGITDTGCTVCSLPGNPVAALCCLYRYILPELDFQSGTGARIIDIELTAGDGRASDLTRFVPAIVVERFDGHVRGRLLPNNGSGDIISLTHSDGFVELSPQMQTCSGSLKVPLYLWADVGGPYR